MIGRIVYLMAKGYDSSTDMMYGPVGALICAVEAGTLLVTMRSQMLSQK